MREICRSTWRGSLSMCAPEVGTGAGVANRHSRIALSTAPGATTATDSHASPENRAYAIRVLGNDPACPDPRERPYSAGTAMKVTFERQPSPIRLSSVPGDPPHPWYFGEVVSRFNGVARISHR